MLDGAAVFTAGWSSGWAPALACEVSEWAEKNIVLSGKAASEPGPYRVERTPYAREPMDCMSVHSAVEEAILIWGAQTSKSTIANNCVGYWIDIEPSSIMFVQPTLALAKRYSRQRIGSMIESTPALRAKVSANRSRDDANTTLMKDFDGGVIVIAGANSAADLRSMPVRYLVKDEVDGYPDDVDGEGDPCDLANARQTTFARKKRITTSTPADEITSRIEPLFKAGSRAYYHVPCPHCGTLQRLVWANVRWVNDDPDTAAYLCASDACGALIEERHKATMLLELGRGGQARWIHEDPGAQGGKVKSYHLSSLYSPLGWASWASLVADFLVAKRALDHGDITKMKTFVNVRLAETWKDQGEQANASELVKRGEAYALGTVPAGALLLLGAGDVQGNRIEFAVKGFGRDDESWLVDYQVIWGDPAELLSGKDPRLDEAQRRVYMNVHGREMRLAAIAMDSGGHHTHDVYMHTRNRRARHVFAVKGQSLPGKPILGKPSDVEVNYRGAKMKRGAQLWPVGSDTAKELIYGRLRIADPGPGYMHFSRDLPEEYYAGLTAETLVTRFHKGRPRREWVLRKGRRNEPLDLEVYALAAAHYAGVTRMKSNQWDALERRLAPDLFSPPLPAGEDSAVTTPPAGVNQPPAPSKPADQAKRPARYKRPGFVNRWNR